MEESLLTTLFLPLALVFIMLGMGLGLSTGDFTRFAKNPKAVFLGLFNQIILLPIVGFMLINVFGLTGSLAVGLMIVAACPGGATSNLITHLSRGDTALSISLTALSSFITFITIPFIINFSIGYFGEEGVVQLPILKTALQIVGVTIIPVIIGMVIRKKRPDLSDKMDRPVRIASAIFLAAIIVAALLKERDHVVDFFIQTGPATLALNVITLLLGFLTATALSLPRKQKITISIESGIQNGTLGIMIAATLLQNPTMAIPVAIYSLIMFFTATVVILASNKFALKKD
jgi:bile acid:Na+ symporter, BASS family